MKNIIIKGIYAVGMHHLGSRSLPIDEVLYVKNELENHFTENAVAVFRNREMSDRCAYLQKKYAAFISLRFHENLIQCMVY